MEDGGDSEGIASSEARHGEVGHDTGSMRDRERECVTKLDMCIADCKLFLLLSSSAMECSPSPPPRVP